MAPSVWIRWIRCATESRVRHLPARIERSLGGEDHDVGLCRTRLEGAGADAGEIGAGHTVTAFYEVKLKQDAPERLATVRVRHMEPQGDTARETVFRFHKLDVHPSVADASKDFRFGAAVTTFAEILRESPHAEGLSHELVEEVAQGAAGKSSDRLEFLELVRAADALLAR